MWVQTILIAAFSMILFMLMRTKKNDGKLKVANESPSAVLGALKTLQVALSFIVGGSVPNYELLENWSKVCGGLMVINVPFKRISTVNIADLHIAKRIMNLTSWVNRFPDEHYIYSSHFNKPLGLLFGNGPWWKESRKLTMKLLHQMDFFRLENVERFIGVEIDEITSNLDEQLRNFNGEAITRVHQMFQLHTLNIVYQVIMAKRFEHSDPIVKELLTTINIFNREFNVGTSVLEIIPWLRKIPGLTYMDSYDKASQVCYDYFKKEVLEKRRKSGTYRREPIDFADYFLLEIDKRAGENPCYITDESFLVCMRDMVFAGSDTTSAVLEHGLLHVSLRPEIQRRLQAEIDHVIGHNRVPVYADRSKMPYTQAVILEIMRYATPVPIVARSPSEDTELNGNCIQKGSFCAVNVYAIHRSPEVWDDPEDFRPERFLNEQREIVNIDKIMPFGHGKRLCVGESVARITLFIFFVSLIQKYWFEISDKHPPPSFKNGFGVSRCPMPYYVKVRSRSQCC